MGTVKSRKPWWQAHQWRMVEDQNEFMPLSPVLGDGMQTPPAVPGGTPKTQQERGRAECREPRGGAGPVLAEFDWYPLRRAWDDDERAREQRAELSLNKLDRKLRARQLRRRLTPLAAVLLGPLAVYLVYRQVRLHVGHA